MRLLNDCLVGVQWEFASWTKLNFKNKRQQMVIYLNIAPNMVNANAILFCAMHVRFAHFEGALKNYLIINRHSQNLRRFIN